MTATAALALWDMACASLDTIHERHAHPERRITRRLTKKQNSLQRNCLQNLSVAFPSRPDLCNGHRSLFSPPLPCTTHLCLAERQGSFHSFVIVLAILPCRWRSAVTRSVRDELPTLLWLSKCLFMLHGETHNHAFSKSVTRCFALRLLLRWGVLLASSPPHNDFPTKYTPSEATPQNCTRRMDVHLLLLF